MNQIKLEELFQKIGIERAVGTEGNHKVLAILEKQLSSMDYEVLSIPITCTIWNHDNSCIQYAGKDIHIEVSPFSESFIGEGIVRTAGTMDELLSLDCHNSVMVLKDHLVIKSLQPKNYPFYYPDEDKELIELLESKEPAAIIVASGHHPMCGLDPFPLFEDGNFLIPSAYISNRVWEDISEDLFDRLVSVNIFSRKEVVESKQLVATKKAKENNGKIVICAHMDSKYNTPGALDNGIGVVTLLEMVEFISTEKYDIDIVPFNGEEYYEASGELAYLDYLRNNGDTVKMVINIDSPCHIGSEIAVSTYNLEKPIQIQVESIVEEVDRVCLGNEWYSGDHAAFAFQMIPCIAISSSDLFEGALDCTHSVKDVASTVDISLINPAVQFVIKLIAYMESIL